MNLFLHTRGIYIYIYIYIFMDIEYVCLSTGNQSELINRYCLFNSFHINLAAIDLPYYADQK